MTAKDYEEPLLHQDYIPQLYKTIFSENQCEPGEVEILKPDSQVIKGLPNDNLRKVHHRQKDFFKIVDFIKEEDPDKNVLIVLGRSGLRKLNVVLKAIDYCHDHQYESLNDGSYNFWLNSIDNRLMNLLEKFNRKIELDIKPDLF